MRGADSRVWFSLAAVVLLALAAYSNSFGVPFNFDDYGYVDNKYIRDLANVPRFFASSGLVDDWNRYLGNTGYRPLLLSSYAVSYAQGGLDVTCWHAFNLLLHMANIVLVFLVVKKVLEASGREGGDVPALLASAVFALHPIQTNAVTYISGRSALLATTLYLLSFLFFLAYRTGRGKGSAALIHAALSPILFLLGLFAKEIAVSLIAVMLAYDIIFSIKYETGTGIPSRRRQKLASLRQFLFYIPFMAALGGYLFLKRGLQGFVAEKSFQFAVSDYLVSQMKILLLYFRLLLFPFNQNADYNLPIMRAADIFSILGIFSAVLFFAILVLIRRKNPAASFFGLWFLLAWAPESTLIPIPDLAVEYRLYLPSVGFFAMLAAVLMRVNTRTGTDVIFEPANCLSEASFCGRKNNIRLSPRLAFAAALAVLLMFGVLTFARNEVWRSPVGLWADVVKKAPLSKRAHVNYGHALFAEGRFEEAAAQYEIYLHPTPPDMAGPKVLNNLGICYEEMGRKAEAAEAYRRAIRIAPEYPVPYKNLGKLYTEMGLAGQAGEVMAAGAKAEAEYSGGVK